LTSPKFLRYPFKINTKEYMRIAKEKGSGWVDYWFPKPVEKEPSFKTTYVLKQNSDSVNPAALTMSRGMPL